MCSAVALLIQTPLISRFSFFVLVFFFSLASTVWPSDFIIKADLHEVALFILVLIWGEE